jgi:hypothetical protein
MATDKEIAAYKAGEALQIEILKNGITIGAIQQLTNIIKNHPEEYILKALFNGLLGVVKDD